MCNTANGATGPLSRNVQTSYDPVSTVKYNVFNGNQWVSYDDEQSFTDKRAYLTSHCLSGAMVWAVDQDDSQYDALVGLLGAEALAGSLFQGGNLTDTEKTQITSQYVLLFIFRSTATQ